MSKSSNKKSSKQSKEKNNDLHKVIIRCLPSNLTEEQFLEQISPLPAYNYFRFVAADKSYGRHSFCRAYINFVNTKNIVEFFEKYDGYPITDSKGKQYPAIVELAPFQGIPKKKKRDPKCGTIESDKDYLSFLACLEEKKDSTHITEAPIDMEDTKSDTLLESTPLLDYLKARKSGNKLKHSQLQKTESSAEQSEIGNTKKTTKHDPPKNTKESSKSVAKGKGSANYKFEKTKEKNEPNSNNEHKTSVKSKDRAPEKRELSKKVTEQRHNHKDKSKGTEMEKRTNDNDKDHKTKVTSSSSKRNEARQSDIKSERRSKSASKKSVDQSVPHEKSKKDRINDTREDISVKKKSSEGKRHDSSTKNSDNGVSKMGDSRDQARRIRNKDRPDRAVYNPRQRFSRSAEVEEEEEKRPRSSRSQSSKK